MGVDTLHTDVSPRYSLFLPIILVVVIVKIIVNGPTTPDGRTMALNHISDLDDKIKIGNIKI